MRFASTSFSVALVGIMLIGIGCGPSEAESEAGGESWTVDRDGIQLEEDLVVTDSDDFYFGRIFDVAVREDGRIYVADGEEHHVKVLSPDGELLDTIGRQGEGPGEFEIPGDLALARGDSLYVLDGYQGRVSVFSPNHDFEYSFMARGEQASPGYMMVPDTETSLWFAFTPYPRLVILEGVGAAVRTTTTDGVIGDTLFEARPPQTVGEGDPNGRMTYYSAPYLRASRYALGPDDRIHHAWSDSLRVTRYDGTGRRLGTVDIPFEAVPVTEADIERELEGRNSDARAVVEPEIPETKPAFDRFLVDDGGRYWFRRPTEDHERADWWIADPETQYVAVVSLPSDVEFVAVRDGFAYGRAESEGGAPALVRYRVVES